jgi:hypothetical protein
MTLTWRQQIEQAVDVFKWPHEYLTPPGPDEATLDDLLTVRAVVQPLPSLGDQLAQIRHQGVNAWAGAATDTTLAAVRVFVNRCASGDLRFVTLDVVRDWMNALDRAITARLETTTPEEGLAAGIISTALFPQTVTLLDGDRKIITGTLDGLPAGHPYRGIVPTPCAALTPTDGATPLAGVALGTPALNGWGRPFYLVERARLLTDKLVRFEESQLALRPVWTLTEQQLARLRARESQPAKPPGKPAALPPAPPRRPARPEAWAARVQLGLKTLAGIASPTLWRNPDDDVPLADLLAIRSQFISQDLFSGDEDDPEHLRYAAERTALRWSAEVRRDELIDLIASLIGKIDKLAGNATQRGIEWSARRGTDVDAALAELRDEVAALRKEAEKRGAKR